jgi:hypothetical protein
MGWVGVGYSPSKWPHALSKEAIPARTCETPAVLLLEKEEKVQRFNVFLFFLRRHPSCILYRTEATGG